MPKDNQNHPDGFTPGPEDLDLIRRAREKFAQAQNAPPVSRLLQDRIESEMGLTKSDDAKTETS